MLRLLRFLYLWGTIGFFAGTLTLLGPVRWDARLDPGVPPP